MKNVFKGATFYIFIFLMILVLVNFSQPQKEQDKKLAYTQLQQELSKGNVVSVKIVDYAVTGKLKDGTQFQSYVPPMVKESFGAYVDGLGRESKLEIEGQEPVGRPWIMDILPTIFMILVFVVFWFVFMQNSQGGGNKVMSFGKSKARLNNEDDGRRITFKDVAGLKKEKEEMREIVDFLKSPKKYNDMGARIPKGILMVGPPGTGKTYLTRAVAGEAEVPFFSISGSDFVEMFVGVGASRVRDTFDMAKKKAPCIVFIDEIDAVGRRRGAGLGGGHDEREQTLNQLLVEMDGFSENEGIIIIAATNRPDILDPALLRPGRFDREVTVGIPDVSEREEMFMVHAKNKPLEADVDLKVLARGTPGFTPADIENIMNEAAILTARKGRKKINMETIEEAKTKVVMGVEKKSHVISEKERRLTAYHEAGHAILAKSLPDVDPVHRITIIPRGRAGGFTMQLPREDRSYTTKSMMENELVILLGGRVAEKLVLHDVSTGAQSDLKRVSSIARNMITRYAMSENLSSMMYGSDEEVFIGRDMTSRREYSEQVAAEIDREIQVLVDSAYERAVELLTENLEKLHEVAKALLEFETITGEEFDMVMHESFEKLSEARGKGEAEPQNPAQLEEEIPAEHTEAQEAVSGEADPDMTQASPEEPLQ